MVECIICKTKVEEKELSKFASFGGLPSPCCKICFEVNDYSITDLSQLAIRSLCKRLEITLKEKAYNAPR